MVFAGFGRYVVINKEKERGIFEMSKVFTKLTKVFVKLAEVFQKLTEPFFSIDRTLKIPDRTNTSNCPNLGPNQD